MGPTFEAPEGGTLRENLKGWLAHHFSITRPFSELPSLLETVATHLRELEDGFEVLDIVIAHGWAGDDGEEASVTVYLGRTEGDGSVSSAP